MVYVQSALPVVDADVLIVPWFEDDSAAAVGDVSTATGGELERAIGTKELSGRLYELFIAAVIDANWKARRIAFIGAGRASDFGAEVARRIAAAAGLALKQRRVGRAAFLLRTAATRTDEVVISQAVAEGLTLSEFNAGSYKTSDIPPGKPPAWTIVGGDDCSSAVARGRLLGECSNLARDMANEPANTLTPREFAQRSQTVLAGTGVTFEVLDEKQI